jgi:hypothetical protein
VPVNLGEFMISQLNKELLLLHNKWKYFRVYNANLDVTNNQLTILSSYSNQEM